MSANTFTQGKILPLLTVLVLFALMLQTMYGAVNLLVIGPFCTAADISAVSICSQIMQLVNRPVDGYYGAVGPETETGRYEGC